MAKCVQILKACQDVEAKLDYGFDWTREFSRRWEADHPYGAGVIIRPEGPPTGFEYQSSGGQSAAIEPEWPSTVGATVVDGSITWTAQLMSTGSYLHIINTDSWSASSPAGLTVVAETPVINEGQQATFVTLSGGVAGETYAVDNEVVTVFGGLEFIARIIIKIE